MNKVFTVAIVLLTIALAAACAPSPTPPPPAVVATAVPTSRPPTAPPPTSPPPTQAPPPPPAPTVAVPPTAAPTAVPQPTVRSGLYVTNLRIQPIPTYNTDLTFYATFLNTTDRIQNFTWDIYIYRGDTPWKNESETSRLATGFPVGTGEYVSLGKWHYGIPPDSKECTFFFARVAWFDENNKVIFFTNTDGKEYELQFKVCMPSALPTSAPVGAAPPTAPPAAPGPGLFVTGIRLSPEKPGRNTDVSFYATFANTTNTVQNFTWRVYIFKSDTLDRSNSETTFTGTSFPAGSGEYKSQGVFRYGYSPNQCDDFIARVGWADQNNKITFFTDTTGKMSEKPFSVCN